MVDDAPAHLYRDVALKLVRAGLYEQAEASFRAALAAAPRDALTEWGLAHALLGMGRYSEGLPLLRSRFQVAPGKVRPPSATRPEWCGESLASRTLLVVGEQGFGDQIMLARFLPKLRQMGARVILATWPPLARLLEPLCDVVVAGERGAAVATPAYDFWTHLFTLPERLGITLENMPAEPYLSAPTSSQGGVGLCWRTNDAARSLPAELAADLLAKGCRSLQPEDTGAQDFAASAAIIAGLDLVVTIDTATAHLAGAMGRPVWVMLPAHAVDWRWMRAREDSPWYPTARLWRHAPDETWDDLVRRVAAEIP